MEIVQLEVSTQQHIDRMQETAKVNYVQYGKGAKKSNPKPRPSGGSGSSGNARKPSKLTGKGRKVPLPTDICWRCGKSRHHKGQHCKALEAVCRGCGTKGHYKKVWMKKSTHLVDVPGTSTNSDPDYFDEHGEPIYVHAHMVHAKAINKKKHLIQFLMSVNLEKVRKPAEGSCPTVLLKADTGADVNLLNLTTLDRIIGDTSILQASTLRMEAYGNSTVPVLGKFYVFLSGKVGSTGNYSTSQQPMHHLIYSPEMVATLWQYSSLAVLWKHPDVPADSKGNPKQNLHSLKLTLTNPRCMVIHHIIWEMKELNRRICLISPSSLSTRSNFKTFHWRSMTSLECTLTYSLELGVSRTSIQVPAEIKCKAS